MLPFQIKICGITVPQHAIDAMESGADAIGLNFFQKSKRSVDTQTGTAIATQMRAAAASQQRHTPLVIGVFVNHSVDAIVSTATELKLDGIQLHGNETTCFFGELTQAVENAVPDSGQRPFYIRAVRTQPAKLENQPSNRDLEIKRVETEIADWTNAGVDLILLDAASAKEFGGTGETIDWNLVSSFQAAIDQPIVLAGGLNPTNVREAIKISSVRMVDTASGVESEPGIKDRQAVVNFVDQAKSAFVS